MEEKESPVAGKETETEAGADVYVDHRETVIQVHGPPKLSVSKKEVTSGTEGRGAEGDNLCPEPEVRTEREKQETATAAAVTTTTQHATTIYTQKIGGWKTGKEGAGVGGGLSRDEGARDANGARADTKEDVRQDKSCADQTDVVNNNSVVLGSNDVVAEIRKEICTIEVSVGADGSSPAAASTTTTAFSKVFGKTVDTDTTNTTTTATTTTVETVETSSSKDHHLSQWSISISGHEASSIVQEAGKDAAFSEATTDSSEANEKEERQEEKRNEEEQEEKEQEEKEQEEGGKEKEDKVAGYHPGLAIRALTLEGLLEKRVSPDREPASSDQITPSLVKNTANDLSALAASDKPNDTCAISPANGGPAAAQTSASAGEGFVSGDAFPAGRQLGTAATGAEWGVPQGQRPQQDSYTASGHLLTQCTEDAQAVSAPFAARSKPLFNPIEVERKFSINDHTESRLRALGAQLRVEKTFHDVYYDNDNYSLILGDCWLRRRNDVWEALVPAKAAAATTTAAAAAGSAQDQAPAQYRELSSEKAISAWLVQTLGLDAWLKGDPMELVVQAAGLSEFAHVVTTRRSYTLPSCTVVLDFTDHGFRVGEIEVMAAAPDDVPRALKTISSVAEQLGLSLLKLA